MNSQISFRTIATVPLDLLQLSRRNQSSSEDTVELYLGGVAYPLDSPSIWRYTAKDALQPPKVPAIDQLRKAINETEKALQQKHKP